MTGSPACWSWPVPPPATRESELKRKLHEEGARLSAAVIEMGMYAWPMGVIARWHEGRCAICGVTGQRLVEDHEHWTGLTRGYLCRSCNVREGARTTISHPVFQAYRERPPAAILGLRAYYSGAGWREGWWLNERLARDLTGNPAWVRVDETE